MLNTRPTAIPTTFMARGAGTKPSHMAITWTICMMVTATRPMTITTTNTELNRRPARPTPMDVSGRGSGQLSVLDC